MLNVGEKINSDDEINLVKKLMLKIQSANQIVSNDDFQELIYKKYMDNIHVFRVFNTEIIDQYINENSNHNSNKQSESETNTFEEKAWETVSRNLDGFMRSSTQAPRS